MTLPGRNCIVSGSVASQIAGKCLSGKHLGTRFTRHGNVNERVLLVEDDASLRETTTLLLERSGMVVTAEGDGKAAIDRFHAEKFDLLVLDIMLPGMDGLEICRTIRQSSQVPIVMLTARAETSDLVAGLELGADDYVTKPFDGPELTARTRAVLRRTNSEPHATTLEYEGLVVDPSAFRATKNGQVLELSATEFKLLVELMRNTDQVLTREALLRRVWEYDYMGDSRMVDMAVKRLRAKVEDEAAHPRYISTVRGIGYRFGAQ
jgi:two-component system response regulator MtrA